MDPFSQPSASATCSALSDKAQLMAAQIQLGFLKIDIQDDVQRQLFTLSTRLQQLAHHADQLGHCVADAAVVHRPFGDTLALGLAKCQEGLSTVDYSLNSLERGADRPLCQELIAGHESFVAAYSRLFILGTQLLIMWVSASTSRVTGVSQTLLKTGLGKLSRSNNPRWLIQGLRVLCKLLT